MSDLTLDKRYVYGFCTWHNSINKAGKCGGFPCCPHCGSMLMECPTEQSWQDSVNKYDEQFTGYAKLVTWGRGKCFPSFTGLLTAYNIANNTKFNSSDFGM